MFEPDLPCITWRKSARSGNGQNCVKVGVWQKSSRSGNGSDCVEVTIAEAGQAGIEHKANAERLYLLRDSKDPDGPVLAFTPGEWDASSGGVKDGEFDDLA
ncbi:DUF397 domain-containing protein [Sphaerimonospora sp. CA-214678]|uniref:DUF397 domain-containing protein n=1 Tax=Sphaerimonospora sp. CA-214678 TaxID=3240029 RepID=UPI003D9393A1